MLRIITRTNINPSKNMTYPYLGEFKIEKIYKIVLFLSQNTGVILLTNDVRESVGVLSQTWEEKYFDPFRGSVTMSNININLDQYE